MWKLYEVHINKRNNVTKTLKVGLKYKINSQIPSLSSNVSFLLRYVFLGVDIYIYIYIYIYIIYISVCICLCVCVLFFTVFCLCSNLEHLTATFSPPFETTSHFLLQRSFAPSAACQILGLPDMNFGGLPKA